MTLSFSSGCLPAWPWILVVAHVIPRPTVESIFFHAGDVVGDEIVSEGITLVDRAPQLAGGWIHGNADGIANARGVDFDELAIGRELQDIGAMKLSFGCVGFFCHIRARAHGDEKLCAIGREGKIASHMAAGRGKRRNNGFGGAGRLQVSVVIGKTNNGICVSDIDPLRIIAEGVKSNSERQLQAGGKYGSLLGLTVARDASEDIDLIGAAIGEEKIAIGCSSNLSRHL